MNSKKTKIMAMMGLMLCIIPMIVIQPVSAADSFSEECTTIDATLWKSRYSVSSMMPTASNGIWTFTIPTGSAPYAMCQLDKLIMSGYGTYEIRFKIDSGRVLNTRWYIFLYGDKGDYNPEQMEMDFVETDSSRNYPGELTISMWVNGKATTPQYGGGMGIGYWYITPSINAEDKNWHTFRFEYSATDVIEYIDGVKWFQWTGNCVNTSALGIPEPPMSFMIGAKAGSTGGNAAPLVMSVDYIRYTSSDYIPPPSNSPPSAVLSATPLSGIVPLTVAFDCQGSIDSDGSIASYLVDFGDGSAASSQASGSHAYSQAGTYTLTVTVTDDDGGMDSVTQSIVASEAGGGGPVGENPIDQIGGWINNAAASISIPGGAPLALGVVMSVGFVSFIAWLLSSFGIAGSRSHTQHSKHKSHSKKGGKK